MKKIILMGASLFMLLAASPVHAQKKEDKKTTREVRKETTVSKSAKSTTTTTVADANKKDKGKTKTSTTVTKDKEVAKDAQGRTIYEGPKGGRYYLSKDGKKVYVKK